MKEYQFTRKAIYTQFGVVTADSIEEAKQLIIDGEYDDIIDTYLEDEDNETIEISNEEGEENE